MNFHSHIYQFLYSQLYELSINVSSIETRKLKHIYSLYNVCVCVCTLHWGCAVYLGDVSALVVVEGGGGGGMGDIISALGDIKICDGAIISALRDISVVVEYPQ